VNKVCACNLHKERKFLNSLKKKLSENEFKKLEEFFGEKWQQADDVILLKCKMDETWPGTKYRKALVDMHRMGWFDNLTFIELANKARELE